MSLERILRWARRELGGAGLAGLAVLAGALAFLALGVRPLETENARLARELARLESPRAGPGAPAPGSAQQVVELRHYLQTEQSIAEWLRRLQSLARTAELEMSTAEYRLRDAGRPVERYEIAVPVTGSYAQVRQFIDSSLHEIPVLALDQVAFSRQRASDARIQADLHFTLYLSRP